MIRYIAVGTLIAVGMAIVAYGQGLIGRLLMRVIDEQPSAGRELTQLATIGLALAETTAIICLVGAFLLLLSASPITVYGDMLYGLVALVLMIPAAVLALIVAIPVTGALQAAAAQPFLMQRITQLMLIMQTVMQTSMIFSFVIALLLLYAAATATGLGEVVRASAAVFIMGLGTIGPLCGLGIFSRAVCNALEKHPGQEAHIRSFVFVAQAFIETPALIAFTVALMVLFFASETSSWIGLGATAVTVGIGTFGPGYASGYVAGKAVTALGRYPVQATPIARSSLLAQALIDTNVIYVLIIALSMLLGT